MRQQWNWNSERRLFITQPESSGRIPCTSNSTVPSAALWLCKMSWDQRALWAHQEICCSATAPPPPHPQFLSLSWTFSGNRHGSSFQFYSNPPPSPPNQREGEIKINALLLKGKSPCVECWTFGSAGRIPHWGVWQRIHQEQGNNSPLVFSMLCMICYLHSSFKLHCYITLTLSYSISLLSICTHKHISVIFVQVYSYT